MLWVTDTRDPFTELALSSLGPGYDVLVASSKEWPPKDAADVTVFDGWTPPSWPKDVPAIVINPPASFGPVRVARLQGSGLAVRVRATNSRHPVLFGVANDRVGVVQTSVLEAGSQLEPLWLSMNSEPILLAGQIQGQSLVVLGCEPARSENLPLLASYPLLVGNTITWTAEKVLRSGNSRNHHTGDLVELSKNNTVSWSGVKDAAPVQVHVPGPWYELDRLGAWQASSGEVGTASLLAPEETRLTGESTSAASGTRFGWYYGDLSIPLLWGVLAVLLGESWLFHRRAVY